MATAAEPASRGLFRQIIADLAPFPGRAGLTWRTALLCAIVSAVAMAYEIPEAAISCYLVIFIMKPDGSESMLTAVGLIVLVTLVVAFVVMLARWTADAPMLRLAAMAFTSFCLLFLGAASKLGEVGGVIALVIAFALTLVDQVPVGDVITVGLRYAWDMAVMPMALMVAFTLVLGRFPVTLLREMLRHRLAVVADVLESGDAEAAAELRDLLREGNGKAEQRAGRVRLLHLVSSDAARQIARDVDASYLLLLAAAGAKALPGDTRVALAAQVRAALVALDASEAMPVPPPTSPEAGPAERDTRLALAIMAGAEPPLPQAAGPKEGFLAADAWTNPDYQRFALKTTLAAMVCYIVYAGMDWQGIHTAMITCYVAALGTTGETVHKLALRIGGCLVGAALGVSAILFVVPHLQGIGGLMALVFAGTLVGAWVSSGNERIAYAGVQIALAFLLTILQGFGPSLDLGTARDRIIGILLGNLVIYLIFTRIWPAPIEPMVRARLSEAMAGLARIAQVPAALRAGAVAQTALVNARLTQADEALALLPFEPPALRPPPEGEARLREVSHDLGALNRDLLLTDADVSPIAGELAALADAVRAPASVPALPEHAAIPETIRARLDRLRAAVTG
ncbi:FUSC family protein [Aquabacter sp. L1I39]|uniref:FUSC family protein n=1 Tax=Aquabacter sp. L1I39 TaxID=2820278 RepID=UPI001ADD2018|nr:FUSC family protein [Aquabacter sp. L1I39]QTL02264.1 FUSC family protein [Aquabacter sp. L1I39]